MHGGKPGALGVNLFIKKSSVPGGEDRVINLGPKNSLSVRHWRPYRDNDPWRRRGWGDEDEMKAGELETPSLANGAGLTYLAGNGTVSSFQSAQNSN